MSMPGERGSEGDVARILIVDDDPALGAGLKLAMERRGYLVEAVGRGSQALDSALAFGPDLIVLDVMMPGVDGWEVLTRLRANEVTEGIPVIMLTAADSEASMVRGFGLGADDYMTKPFSLQELRCRISAVLRRCQVHSAEDTSCRLAVLTGGSSVDLVCCHDVYFVSGIRNYTYVHTLDCRFLSRLTLGALERRGIDGFMRVHRSFIVNTEHVKGCGWVSKSSYRLRLADLAETEVPVSRALIAEVQRQLGVHP